MPVFVCEIITYQFSWLILLLLVFLLLVSVGMYTIVVRRATTGRHWVAMQEWARQHRFRMVSLPAPLPPPLDRIADMTVRPTIVATTGTVTLVRLESIFDEQSLVWHAMIHEIESDWPATALRPGAVTRSLLDHFQLQSHAALSTERFEIIGESRRAAQALADSSERAILPADIGLLLIDRLLLIDFSARPFDPIQFMRIMAMAQQLIAHLPQMAATKK